MSPSRQCPVTYRQRVPGSVQEKSGVRRGCGRAAPSESHQPPGPAWGDTGPSLRPGFKPRGCHLLPKISNSPNFCVFLVFNQSTAGRWRCRAGDTDPAQLRQGSVPGGTGGRMWLCPHPPTSNGHPFLGPGLRLPAKPLSKRGAAGGAARRERGHAQGQGDSWGRDHTLPYSEGPHFGGALGGGRGGAFVQVLQRPLLALVRAGAVLCALHVIPGGPWGHGDG